LQKAQSHAQAHHRKLLPASNTPICVGAKVTDLHRHFIDHLTIPSRQGKGLLKRVDDVFDCWFESGSMPYAQVRLCVRKPASSYRMLLEQ